MHLITVFPHPTCISNVITFQNSVSYLIPLVVQVADDGVGFTHELFPFVEGRRERAERGAFLPVPLDEVPVHGHLETGILEI